MFSQRAGSQKLWLNQASDGVCDFTMSSVFGAEINPNFLRKDIEESGLFQFVMGRRVRIGAMGSDNPAEVISEEIFLPPDFLNEVYGSYVNKASMATTACFLHEALCEDEYSANGYNSSIQCTEKLHSLPVAEDNAKGYITVDSNSTGCRHLHMTMALHSPEIHCPHFSFQPMEDPNGKIKCSDSSDYAIEDYFNENDISLFRQSALIGGMEYGTYYKKIESRDDLGSCEGRIFEVQSITSLNGMPQTGICRVYLETHRALGDRNDRYLLGLVLAWIIPRTLAFFMYQRKALA